ncbi:MAG: hypothetical protein ACI8W3_003151 [Myxococcota bacterium]|jgi:hypothetical protein
MDATFFVANQKQAVRVRHFDDLPVDPLADPLFIQSPKALTALASAVSGSQQPPMQPLRDATCQSFPIFTFEPAVVKALSKLNDEEVDEVAERWLEAANWEDGEVDLYELSEFLKELNQGLGGVRNIGEHLYILLEEKAY